MGLTSGLNEATWDRRAVLQIKSTTHGDLSQGVLAARAVNYERGAADGNRAETATLSKFSESCARDMTGFALIA